MKLQRLLTTLALAATAASAGTAVAHGISETVKPNFDRPISQPLTTNE